MTLPEADKKDCTLDVLGWRSDLQVAFDALRTPNLWPARVSAVHRGAVDLWSPHRMIRGRIAGPLKQSARTDPFVRPSVGDWVAAKDVPGAERASVVALLPRHSQLVRQAAGLRTEPQVIVSNVDTVFVVVSLNQDFNVRRVERYLATIIEAEAEPVIVLNKADLVDDPSPFEASIRECAPNVTVHTTSALHHRGLAPLQDHLGMGRTAAIIGSSGTGKSTLINALLGQRAQATGDIRPTDDRGRHTTTKKEMFLLRGQDERPRGVLIDTPGLRELHVWSVDTGLYKTFEDVEKIAESCRFRDCDHQSEPGCAVTEAIEKGTLAKDRVAAYQKLRIEQSQQDQRIAAWTRRQTGARSQGLSRSTLAPRRKKS